MSAATVCSTTLNGCGSLILLLFLLPQLSLHYSRSVNRHRQRLLNDAAVVHLFVLLLRMTGSISALAKGASLVLDSYRVLSAGLWVLSAGFAILINHSSRFASGTNRNERVLTSNCLSCKMS